MPERVELSMRLKEIFTQTKLVCFGRYVLEVPLETKLDWGEASITDVIEIIHGGAEANANRIANDIAEIKKKHTTFDITYNKKGPVDNSWQIRYYEDELAKEFKLHFFNTYVNKGDLTFILGGSVGQIDTEEVAAAKQAILAKNLRLRDADEVPSDPGYCIEHAFIHDEQYADQETVSIGFHFPSLLDVSFSVSSNKDAYGDYSPANFEKSVRQTLSLLKRIKEARSDQDHNYPSRNVLREGKRDVQHWHGEESLIKREDGTHDFEWAFVGTPKDIANPSEYNVVMYSKVRYNLVGGADKASLSDDEAVAMWDRLISGLKFRVKVPGSPAGTYLFPKED